MQQLDLPLPDRQPSPAGFDSRSRARSPQFGHTRGVVLARHLLRLAGDSASYAFTTRRVALLVTLVLGLLLVAVGLAAKAAAPLVVYPFV